MEDSRENMYVDVEAWRDKLGTSSKLHNKLLKTEAQASKHLAARLLTCLHLVFE